jgi:hypothetical protein
VAIIKAAGVRGQKKEEFYPKIVDVIHQLFQKNKRFIRQDEIIKQLNSTYAPGRERVDKYTQGFFLVCWFSADYTKYKNGNNSVLRWGPLFDQFDRDEIQGRAAYSPTSERAEDVHPDEVSINEAQGSIAFREGATRQVLVNAFERDRRARQMCIDEYGRRCFICSFSFEERYGKVAERIIHVHHLRELSKIRKEYAVDPIKDLRPVCPNCHAVLHSNTPAYSIEQVMVFVRDNQGRFKVGLGKNEIPMPT